MATTAPLVRHRRIIRTRITPPLETDIKVLHTETRQSAAVPLIAGALAESAAREGAEALADFGADRRDGFDPWLGGAVLVLVDRGETVAGGALRRYDSTTAQLDWLWTRPDRRRSGLARRVLAELAETAVWHHYRRLYAMTGPGRTEARTLLASSGFRALAYGPAAGAGTVPPGAEPDYLGFVKALG